MAVAESPTIFGLRSACLAAVVASVALYAAEPRPEDLSLDGARLAELFPELVAGPIRAEVFVEGGDG